MPQIVDSGQKVLKFPVQSFTDEVNSLGSMPWYKAWLLRFSLVRRMAHVQVKLWILHWLNVDRDMQQMRDAFTAAVIQEQKQRVANDVTAVKMIQRIAEQNNKMAIALKECEEMKRRLEFYEKKLPLSNHRAVLREDDRRRVLAESIARSAAKQAAKDEPDHETAVGGMDQTHDGKPVSADKPEDIERQNLE